MEASELNPYQCPKCGNYGVNKKIVRADPQTNKEIPDVVFGNQSTRAGAGGCITVFAILVFIPGLFQFTNRDSGPIVGVMMLLIGILLFIIGRSMSRKVPFVDKIILSCRSCGWVWEGK